MITFLQSTTKNPTLMKSYKILFLLAVLLFSVQLYSQVGIGTTDPEVSSILDMSSTTQGMLAPRMTTVQRNAISSPAEGLLVFDTDENVFYFFNETVWLPLEGAEKRTNYKLVKSVADLADELVAGSGSKYKLNEDYMYEINGTILVDYPIDLNGAYIRGQDTGEDILQNNSSGALFSGDKGGRIKDLLILGNNKQVFNITGSGSESLIAYSLVIVGASSIGTLSTLQTVFFEVLQVTNSGDGLNISTVNSLFVDKVFWVDSNSGTFLTLSGAFGNIQIANGRVVADATETGIDVHLNPTISVSASLSEVSFSGAGDLVNGYTLGSYSGYNFTNDWDVNCPGLPVEKDYSATGDINFNYSVGSGEQTTFTGTGTSSRVKLEGATVSNNLFRFSSGVDNRITYEGRETRYFTISSAISFQGDNNNTIFIFYIAINGSVVEQTRIYRENGANYDVGAAPIVGTMQLDPGDFIEVWAERYSGGGNLFTVSLNLVAR